ncbi:mov34 mpn pad-1 family protein [Cystoisospora suis]|uniref:COP9 signalosome complex subunit 5 n=1 Tax=Cystoisospora suis TaxID=483139 RepID=A0A2C6KL75_9APIC|nr:mov34 mpn pad-1 family protein [Cystoisospora suis]
MTVERNAPVCTLVAAAGSFPISSSAYNITSHNTQKDPSPSFLQNVSSLRSCSHHTMGDAADATSSSSWASLPPTLSKDDYRLFRSLSDREQETLHSFLPSLSPSFFSSVILSPLSLLQMLLHAHSGSPLEVMGLMIGSVQTSTLYPSPSGGPSFPGEEKITHCNVGEKRGGVHSTVEEDMPEGSSCSRRFDGFVINQAFSLPVEGTETRVNAGAEANEYMVEFVKKSEEAYTLPIYPRRKRERLVPRQGRHAEGQAFLPSQAHGEREGIPSDTYEEEDACSPPEDEPDRVPLPVTVVGWYHSHPGYRCWLSGIDVQTQRLHQRGQDPFLAVVVDPTRTAATGQVDIGAFRCYPEGHIASSPRAVEEETGRPATTPEAYSLSEKKADSQRPPSSLPSHKVADFGVHWREYYKLDVKVVASSLDTLLLERLCADAWPSAILGPQRSLVERRAYRTSQISDLVVRTRQAEAATFRRNVATSVRPASSGAYLSCEGLLEESEPVLMDTEGPPDSASLLSDPDSASSVDDGRTDSYASQQECLFGVAEEAERQRRMQKQRLLLTGARLRKRCASKRTTEDGPLESLARETSAVVRDQQQSRVTSEITELLFGKNRPSWLETKRRVRERRLRNGHGEAFE